MNTKKIRFKTQAISIIHHLGTALPIYYQNGIFDYKNQLTIHQIPFTAENVINRFDYYYFLINSLDLSKALTKLSSIDWLVPSESRGRTRVNQSRGHLKQPPSVRQMRQPIEWRRRVRLRSADIVHHRALDHCCTVVKHICQWLVYLPTRQRARPLLINTQTAAVKWRGLMIRDRVTRSLSHPLDLRISLRF